MKNFNSGNAIWNQRFKLQQTKLRLKQLADAVGHISDSSLAQYAQMYAISLEFKPDLIIEFGRGAGNSTAVFTEAANQLDDCSVISICLSNDWQDKTAGRIAKIVPKEWFSKLDARIGNILDLDFKTLIKNGKRILFLWDAHGWDIAEYILGEVLPELRLRDHIVFVHDISYFDPSSKNSAYGANGIWKGYAGDDVKNPPYIVLNSMASPFEEMIAIYDFTSRNSLKIHSVQEEINDIYIHSAEILSIHAENESRGIHTSSAELIKLRETPAFQAGEVYKKNQAKAVQLKKILGKEFSDSSSSFQWFSLNTLSKNKKVFYPKFQKGKNLGKQSLNISFDRSKNNLVSPSENSHPLVSIVTPSFNSGKFIKECIQSVLNQDYPYVEHVIQDGGSKDNTLKILKKYSTPKYKDRIKWISNPDKGQSDGRSEEHTSELQS